MRALWALGEGTVHEVRAKLMPDRSLAYTTVTTVMDYLSKKELVARRKRGRSFVYRPSVSQETVREHALGRLARNFFENSRERLRDYLAGEAPAASAPRADGEPGRDPRPATGIDTSLL